MCIFAKDNENNITDMAQKHIPDSSCQYFNEKEETLSRQQIEALQLERLQATVKHCMNSPFYKARLKKPGSNPKI